mgnify:CR=1 FL=1
MRRYDIIAALDGLLTRDDFWHDPTLPRALSDDERHRFRRLGPVLADRCASLATCSLPLAVTHGDLEPHNVVRTSNGRVIHDWTCAGVAHPFFDLACWISDCDETDAVRAVARYLGAWRSFGSEVELRRQWMLANRSVGCVSC